MLLTIKQAAEELAMSPRQVRRFIESGRLKVVQLTPSGKGQRIHPDDLEAFIRKCRSGGTTVKSKSTLRSVNTISGLEELLESERKRRKKSKI